MKLQISLTTLFLISLQLPIPGVNSARILGLWTMPAPSHFFLGNVLLKELANRGHEVTMIGYFPQKTPLKNFRDIVLDKNATQTKLMSSLPNTDKKLTFVDIGELSSFIQPLVTTHIGTMAVESTLENDNVKKLLKDEKETFDLIIMEMFHTEALYGFAHKYDCPIIVLSTMGSSVWVNHLVSNPAPSSYNPDLFLTYSSHMNFFERLHNFVHTLYLEIYRKYIYFPRLDATLHKYFPEAPRLEQLMYEKTAMVLLNSHPSFFDPKPHVPAMVEIGGFHVEAPKPLPKDLKAYMDNSQDGVIFFSMGSNLKSADLSDEKRNIIMRVFSQLKQNVIWKFEDENLVGKPSNVKIMKWCPQNDIMAHPNLKLFITHGGLLSTTEAIYHGIPLVGIPIFGDQRLNVARTQHKGFGIGITYSELTEDTLSNAINEVLKNPIYKANAKKASRILHDQPLQPLDAAVFWVNHVLKHKGADHLRTAAMDLSWYQLYSVDILVFFAGVNLILAAIFYVMVKKICCRKIVTDKKDLKKKKH